MKKPLVSKVNQKVQVEMGLRACILINNGIELISQ